MWRFSVRWLKTGDLRSRKRLISNLKSIFSGSITNWDNFTFVNSLQWSIPPTFLLFCDSPIIRCKVETFGYAFYMFNAGFLFNEVFLKQVVTFKVKHLQIENVARNTMVVWRFSGLSSVPRFFMHWCSPVAFTVPGRSSSWMSMAAILHAVTTMVLNSTQLCSFTKLALD